MSGRARNRIAWAGAWSRGHNNTRYAELLPRLANVDRYFVDMHPWWPLRGLRRRIWLPLLSIWMGLRYPLVLATDFRQIRLLRGRVVCDHDDPLFRPEEIRALNAPNVAAVVVTGEAVAKGLADRGLRKDAFVIPQGVSAGSIDPKRVRAIRDCVRRSDREVAAGIHQPHFEFGSELGGGAARQMYAVDSLFEAVARARKKEPRLVLWLVGGASRMVREYAEQNPWVRLLGYQPHAELMDTVAAFDIGVYPRRGDLQGRASIKVLEYMACGVPVVGFDVEEMRIAVNGGAGIAVPSVREFSAALVSLAGDPRRRRRLGINGKRAAAAHDWDRLAREYRILLDRILLAEGNG
jgi:glycosyltransferase involved in cell wall biosynthesis